MTDTAGTQAPAAASGGAQRPDQPPTEARLLGLVDGSQEANTRRFHGVLVDDAVVQLDELVVTISPLPDGREVAHYGIVVEGSGVIEGAELASDTQRIAGDHTMPGQTARTVEVQVLRTVPELWLPPAPGAPVMAATGKHRELALFTDQMDAPLPVGVDVSNQPVYVDFSFFDGVAGGHASVSGVSGVATKTSWSLFFLYMILETPQGRRLLGAHSPATRALLFSVKGEDMLHLDRPNAKFAERAEAHERWAALGVPDPGPFTDVRIFAPRAPGRTGQVVPDVHTRPAADVVTYGWPPYAFLREGLLRFVLTDAESLRTQVSFITQRVVVQLARWAHPVVGRPGVAVLIAPPATTSYVLSRIAEEKRVPRHAGDGELVESFADIVDFLARKIADEDPDWIAGTQQGTHGAFLRRLYAQLPRMGHLICPGVTPVTLDSAITVVDIHSLHDDAQRFVVGSLLSDIFDKAQGQGREPITMILLDELNKYAPRDGDSPVKEIFVDIAARGRSLGVLLVGAQQHAGDVDGNVIRNAAIKVVGRLDAGESAEYRFLSPELRERAARFLPGTMVLDQPIIPAPIPMRFPFPAFATNVAEAVASGAQTEQRGADVLARLDMLAGDGGSGGEVAGADVPF